MKSILIIFVGMALLPPIINGGSFDYDSDYGSEDYDYQFDQGEIELNDVQANVDKIIKNGETINNVFKPLEYIDRGCFGLVYKGELTRRGTTKMVAMKISPICMLESLTVNEYDLYTYMKAVDNATVENYGIPAVYYYGVWENCTMLAITLLQSSLSNIINASGLQLTDIDIFILFREYVRISKYMHTHGVCQVDTKLANIMFRKHQCFIIDFNSSKKVYSHILNNGTLVDCRKTDWKSFFISMCLAYRIPFDPVTPQNTLKRLAYLKNPGLKKIFLKFAKYVFTNDLQDYDRMYEIITTEMHAVGVQEPALVSWLNAEQQGQAFNEWFDNPTPEIRSIKNPPTNGQYSYPGLDYVHFDEN